MRTQAHRVSVPGLQPDAVSGLLLSCRLEADADQQVVQLLATGTVFWQRAGLHGVFQFGSKPSVLARVEFQIGSFQNSFLSACHLAMNELWNPGQLEVLIQMHQIGFDVTCTHHVNPGQQNSVHIQQRLNTRSSFLLKQFPLRC